MSGSLRSEKPQDELPLQTFNDGTRMKTMIRCYKVVVVSSNDEGKRYLHDIQKFDSYGPALQWMAEFNNSPQRIDDRLHARLPRVHDAHYKNGKFVGGKSGPVYKKSTEEIQGSRRYKHYLRGNK